MLNRLVVVLRCTMVRRFSISAHLVRFKDSKCSSISESFVQLLPWNMVGIEGASVWTCMGSISSLYALGVYASSSSQFLSWMIFSRGSSILGNAVRAGWLKQSLVLSGLWGWGGGGGLWAVSKVESLARAPRLLRFTLLVSFSDTLLVVSILDIVYDCHLRAL